MKNKITVAIHLVNDEDDWLDECFFILDDETDKSILPYDLDFMFLNFENEKLVSDKLVDDTIYYNDEYSKIKKAVLTLDEYIASKPFQW